MKAINLKNLDISWDILQEERIAKLTNYLQEEYGCATRIAYLEVFQIFASHCKIRMEIANEQNNQEAYEKWHTLLDLAKYESKMGEVADRYVVGDFYKSEVRYQLFISGYKEMIDVMNKKYPVWMNAMFIIAELDKWFNNFAVNPDIVDHEEIVCNYHSIKKFLDWIMDPQSGDDVSLEHIIANFQNAARRFTPIYSKFLNANPQLKDNNKLLYLFREYIELWNWFLINVDFESGIYK